MLTRPDGSHVAQSAQHGHSVNQSYLQRVVCWLRFSLSLARWTYHTRTYNVSLFGSVSGRRTMWLLPEVTTVRQRKLES